MKLLFGIERRKIGLYSLCASLITVVFLYPIISNGIYHSHDITFHLSRIDGILSAIYDGQFPLAIYPYKNYGYGYANPLFYCDLFLIPFAVLYRFGLSLIQCYKLVLWVFTFVGTFLIILTANYITKNKTCSVLAGVLWSFSNYHISNVYIRGALGEIMAASFLPLLIYLLYRIFEEKEIDVILLALTFSCLLLTHIITFTLSVLLFGLLIIIFYKDILKNRKIVFDIVKAAGLAILLSSFFLFPMIEQFLSNHFNFSKNMGTDLMKLESLSILGFLSDAIFVIPNSINEFSYGIGIILVLLGLFAFVSILKLKNKLFKVLTIISLIMMIYPLDILKPENNILFSFMQFPWRMYQLLVPLLSILIAVALKDIKVQKNILMLTVVCMYSLSNHIVSMNIIKNTGVHMPSDSTYVELFEEQKFTKYAVGYLYNVSELSNAEYLPYTYDYSYIDNIGMIQYLNLDDTKIEFKRIGTKLEFSSNLEWGDDLLMPLTYYLGYKAYEVDDNNIIKELDVSPYEYNDRLMFYVESGPRNYLVQYEGTTIQKVSTIISLSTAVALIVKPILKIRGIKNEKNIIC